MMKSKRDTRISGDGVQVLDDVVFRTVVSDRASEIKKLNQLSAIGKEHGFVSPQAWEADQEDRIATEKIEIVQSSQSLYSAAVCKHDKNSIVACQSMVDHAAKSLAAIHEHLNETGNNQSDSGSTTVLLHCDYGFSNIHLDSKQQLVILDPFPQYSDTEIWETGPRSFDLGMFASCLIGRVSPKNLMSLNIDLAKELLILFLKQYNLASDTKVPAQDVFEHASRITTRYFSNSRWLKTNRWPKMLEQKPQQDKTPVGTSTGRLILSPSHLVGPSARF